MYVCHCCVCVCVGGKRRYATKVGSCGWEGGGELKCHSKVVRNRVEGPIVRKSQGNQLISCKAERKFRDNKSTEKKLTHKSTKAPNNNNNIMWKKSSCVIVITSSHNLKSPLSLPPPFPDQQCSAQCQIKKNHKNQFSYDSDRVAYISAYVILQREKKRLCAPIRPFTQIWGHGT